MLLLPLVGLASLLWFLIRVIPKPSRAGYPCMRVAAPLASGFVVWLAGVVGSVLAFHKAKVLLRDSRWAVASLAIAVGLVAAYLAVSNTPGESTVAAVKVPDPVNDPLGAGEGIFPGRVVWVHDPEATEKSPSGLWSAPQNTHQDVVDQMMSKAVRWLTGRRTDAEAWDSLFRHFNKTHGGQDVGYTPGDKINIKVNGVTWSCDENGDLQNGSAIGPAPQMMAALLKQLVNVAGVPQADISIGDPMQVFPNQHYQFLCDAGFPDVTYISFYRVLAGRTLSEYSDVPFEWSAFWAWSKDQDYVPVSQAQAKYYVNFAVLKTHDYGGVTLCGKNMYGSLIRVPVHSGYFNLHDSLASFDADMGSYRAIVDLMGHEHVGGKTLLALIDGLWGGYSYAGSQSGWWPIDPFNDDRPSSLFLSMDQVAVDSVAYDLWWARADEPMGGPSPRIAGGDDYLHEAALADDPPSGMFYDPEQDGTPLESLGVHEHWNNRFDRQYTRNLGTGFGIELITSEPSAVLGRWIFYNNSAFDGNDPAANAQDDGAIAPDKLALLGGQTGNFLHYTSYCRGINGIMVDIDLPGAAPTASDFTFRVGNDSDPSGWAAAPTPSGITVRAGAGVAGTDRITILWPDNAIDRQWLQVTVLPTPATGLSSPDVFYFGNAIGETGNRPTDAKVTPADQVGVRNNPHTLGQDPAGIDDVYDFDRDRQVGPTDEVLCRTNGTSLPSALRLISPPAP